MKNQITLPIIIITLLFLYTRPAVAQSQGVIRGKIVDSLARQALPFATVYLHKTDAGDRTVLTDKYGAFEITGLSLGEYSIRTGYLNHRSNSITIRIDQQHLVYDLGEIHLNIKSVNLKEVTILAKNLVTQNIDGLAYHVDNDPMSKSANLFTIMERVPLLSIDANENIKFEGSSSYKILVDGKPSLIMDRNAKNALKALPANSIDRIQVITSPSGKFYQEGITGIINIITKKNKGDGYQGNLALEYRTPAFGPSGSGTLEIKKNKITWSNFLGYSNQDKPQTTSSLISGTTNQTGLQSNEIQSWNASSDVVYELDSLNLLSARVGFYRQISDDFSDLLTTVDARGTGGMISRYRINSLQHLKWLGYELGADYQRNFPGDPTKVLSFSYLYTNSSDDQENTTSGVEMVNYTFTDNAQFNEFKQHEHTFQLDYGQKIKKIRLETGLKGIMRLGNSNFINQPQPDATIQSNPETAFNNDQYIGSGYLNLSYQVKKWAIKGGLRFENANFSSSFSSQPSTIEMSYNNLLPNLTFSYQLNKTSTLLMSYLGTVQRPNISYLNPFINQFNPNLEVAGNPNLSPVTTNSLNFQLRRIKKSSLVMSLRYSFSKNTIQRVLVEASDDSKSRVTYLNIGQLNNLGLNLSYNTAIIKALNLNFSNNLTYTSISGIINNAEVTRSGYLIDLNVGLTATLNKNLVVNGRYSYSSPSIFLQARTTTFPYFVFSGTQNILNKKVSIGASLINPFSKYRYVSTNFINSGFDTNTQNQIFYRAFILRASYRFGEIKAWGRRNQKTIKNNDAISIK